jgi:hypothetical protein
MTNSLAPRLSAQNRQVQRSFSIFLIAGELLTDIVAIDAVLWSGCAVADALVQILAKRHEIAARFHQPERVGDDSRRANMVGCESGRHFS